MSGSKWYHCGLSLLEKAGKKGKGHYELPNLYATHSLNTSEDFLTHLMALIYVESRFRARSVSHAEAYGLMQVTRIAADEASRQCSLRKVRRMEELLDSATNIRYGTCYLRYLLEQSGGDWTRTLITYNGGYAQLGKYENEVRMASETANYVLQIRKVVSECTVGLTSQ